MSRQAAAIQFFAAMAPRTVLLHPHSLSQSELADLLADFPVRVSFPLPLPRHGSEWRGSFSVAGYHGHWVTAVYQLREPFRHAGLVKLFLEKWRRRTHRFLPQ
jgi:hypothetical protein